MAKPNQPKPQATQPQEVKLEEAKPEGTKPEQQMIGPNDVFLCFVFKDDGSVYTHQKGVRLAALTYVSEYTRRWKDMVFERSLTFPSVERK